MSEKIYTICRFTIHSQHYWFIWFSSETDGVVVNRKQRIFAVSEKSNLNALIKETGCNVDTNDIEVFNCDKVILSLIYNDITLENVPAVLDVINLLSDIGITVKGASNKLEKKINDSKCLYDKLFFGCNLPSINSSDKKYLPKFSKQDRFALLDIIQAGIKIFRKNIQIYPRS